MKISGNLRAAVGLKDTSGARLCEPQRVRTSGRVSSALSAPGLPRRSPQAKAGRSCPLRVTDPWSADHYENAH